MIKPVRTEGMGGLYSGPIHGSFDSRVWLCESDLSTAAVLQTFTGTRSFSCAFFLFLSFFSFYLNLAVSGPVFLKKLP